MSDFSHVVELVEQTIRELGIDPAQCKLPGEGATRWALQRGSAHVVVAVHPGGAGSAGTIRVAGPVVRLPEDLEKHRALYRRLLEANATELAGVAFGVSGDDVIICAQRETEDLDVSEVRALIRKLGAAADRFDDMLADEFGCVRAVDAR